MTPEQIEEIKKSIDRRVVDIESLLAEGNDETKPIEPDVAIGRLSRMDSMQSQQMALEMRRRQNEELARLKTVLERIDSPAYGICARCRKPMPFERLEAMPHAVVCVGCAR